MILTTVQNRINIADMSLLLLLFLTSLNILSGFPINMWDYHQDLNLL